MTTGTIADTHRDGVNGGFFDGHGAYRSALPFLQYENTGTLNGDANSYFYGMLFMVDERY